MTGTFVITKWNGRMHVAIDYSDRPNNVSERLGSEQKRISVPISPYFSANLNSLKAMYQAGLLK